MSTAQPAAQRFHFITPATSLAVVAVTVAGLLNAWNAAPERTLSPAFVVAIVCGALHLLLGTLGVWFVERRGGATALRLHFVAACAVAFVAVAATGGTAYVLLFSLVSQGVLYLSTAGAALVALSCFAPIAVFASVRATSPMHGLLTVTGYFSGFIFVTVFSRIVLRERQARAEVERLASELRDANDRLRAHAKEAEELAAAKERNRIAREIHDGLGHYLTIVHVQLQAAEATIDADRERAHKAVLTAQQLTHEGLCEVRRSVALLRGAAPASRPIVDALERLASECAADGLDAEVKVDGAPRPLDDAVEFTLYRAAQEALTNVRRHAKASKVTIELGFASAGVRLRVEDDGVGTDRPSGGFGLMGLRERAELVGGTISTRTARGHGFTLELEVPS